MVLLWKYEWVTLFSEHKQAHCITQAFLREVSTPLTREHAQWAVCKLVHGGHGPLHWISESIWYFLLHKNVEGGNQAGIWGIQTSFYTYSVADSLCGLRQSFNLLWVSVSQHLYIPNSLYFYWVRLKGYYLNFLDWKWLFKAFLHFKLGSQRMWWPESLFIRIHFESKWDPLNILHLNSHLPLTAN